MLVLDNLDIALFHIHLICAEHPHQEKAGSGTVESGGTELRGWKSQGPSLLNTMHLTRFERVSTLGLPTLGLQCRVGVRSVSQSVRQTDRQAGQTDRRTDGQTDHRPC